MVDVRIKVARRYFDLPPDQSTSRDLHRDRARLVHGLIAALDIDVKDWGLTDDPVPREIVELIVALGSAGVFSAMVAAFKIWIERDKIEDVEIESPTGLRLRIAGATAREIRSLVVELGLDDHPPRKRSRAWPG